MMVYGLMLVDVNRVLSVVGKVVKYMLLVLQVLRAATISISNWIIMHYVCVKFFILLHFTEMIIAI